MTILVTGSAGYLGRALVHTLRNSGQAVIGMDIQDSDYTDLLGSITDKQLVSKAVAQCHSIIHTATLHKPHAQTHSRQDFIDTNIGGTLTLLEQAAQQRCRAFIYSSTTSTFGNAMRPAAGKGTVWVTEKLIAQPKNMYGVTKSTAENLCELFAQDANLPCVVLKISRFFNNPDLTENAQFSLQDANIKVNELLFRRVDIADVVSAHQLALAQANEIGFDKFIISAPTPFQPNDAISLAMNAPAIVEKYVPNFIEEYSRRGWRMFDRLDRVYDCTKAMQELCWQPQFTFKKAIQQLRNNTDYQSKLTKLV